MSVEIHLSGTTLAEALKGVAEHLTPALSTFKTEYLIDELRHRLASEENPRVLRILAFDPGEAGKASEAGTATTTTTQTGTPGSNDAAKPKRGRPSTKDKAPPAGSPTQPTQAPSQGAPTSGDEWDTDTTDTETDAGAGGETDTPATYTIEDVRHALDAVKELQGMVTARALMAEHGGSSKLVDIPAPKYPALIAALNKAAGGAKANQVANAKQPVKGTPNAAQQAARHEAQAA